MRHVLGAEHREVSGRLDVGALAGMGWSERRVGQVRLFLETLADSLVGRAGAEDALTAGIVGEVIAQEQVLQVAVGPEAQDQYFASDTAVETLDHAVGLGRVGLGPTMLDAERTTRLLEIGGGEATAVVGQDMG